MRLASLTLNRYGNYESEKIRFDTGRGTVNILLAPNSAGKSVLRSAFGDLLFGIHNQTPMGFRFGYPGMRIAADIVRNDGSGFAFSRRKVRGNVISDEAGQPLDPALLHGVLGGRDRHLLERLFVLDTEGLREGGKALLASGGDVASALLSAAGGIREARATRQQLERQRDELAPSRKTASRPFYMALDQFLNARRGGNATILRPDDWARRERELRDLEERRRNSNVAAEAASAEIARLERIRRVRPGLARLADAEGWLAANPDAPRLADDLAPKLTSARQDIVTKTDVLERARTALANVAREVDDVVVDADLLANAELIQRLTEEAGAARKARQDLPGVSGQRDHGLTRIRDLLRQLGSPLPPERAVEALPKTALVARTRKLIDEYNEIAASMRTSDAQIEARGHDLNSIERRLEQLPPLPDPLQLQSLLEAIRADGDPAVRRSEAEKVLRDAQAALDAARAEVPGWSGEAAALATIAPLTMDIYRRHEADVAAARANAVAAHDRHLEATDRLEKARAALSAIVGQGEIPDETALINARQRRDALWSLIYRRAYGGEPAAEGEQQLSLPLAFERSIVEADTVADRRFTLSELLARIAAARQAIAEAERQAEAAAERARIADEQSLQVRRIWTQLCGPLPLGAEPTLADIQAFTGARERVLDAYRKRELAADTLSALLRRHGQWATALAGKTGDEPSGLPTMLAAADRILRQGRTLRDERLKLEATKSQFDEQLRAATRIRSAQREKLQTWRERWRTAIADLARPDDEEPEATAAVLETLRELSAEYRDTASLSERVNGMNLVIERFTRSIGELTRTIQPRVVSPDPFEAVRELGKLLNRERELEQRQCMARQALATATDEADSAEKALAAARTTLRGLLDLIGADTIEAAEQRLALSAERARYEVLGREAAAELHLSGDGFSIDALRAEAGEISPDSVPAMIEAAANRRREASEAAQRIAEEASASRQRLERDETDTNVNTAAAEQQAAIASLSRTLDDALVYHTASLLLGRALDVIERSGDSRMLLNLGRIFQALTGGAYARVVTELDDNGTAHLGLIQRDFPEERQTVDQLSEGTRDQFFLALRVAAIEDHVASADPLPFIGDDILQTFDDQRALAALRVLAELSQHTQVIVLTHHRHVLDLATQLPSGTIFNCRREPAVAMV
jgi:uncharacterized protein YhaN